jgi:RNA polymerase sigma-70 factor (ECF subfamily)
VSTRDDDRRTAEELILEHLPDIVTLCNRMFRQRSDAEDAVHEAVLAILHALPGYEARGPVRHWVLKVALNAARQHRRALGRKTRRETALPESGLPGAEMRNATLDREEEESLRAAIAELPEEIREAVTLYFFHKLKQTEIAGVLGCTQKTVSVRVKKGLDLLGKSLVGSPAVATMAAAGGTGAAVLDAVPAALVASVKQAVAGHFAASTAATAAAITQSTASSATSSGLAAGGIVMKAKLAAGAAVIAVTCLVGGALISESVFADDVEAQHAAEVAALRTEIEDGRRDVLALEQNLESAQRRNAARVADLNRELAVLREQVAEKDRELAAKDGSDERAAASGDAREVSRGEQWAELQKTMSGVVAILMKMEEEGANQFELGPQMVAELGKLSDEDYQAIMKFDEDETDARRIEEIRSVMLQALIFVPKAEKHRDEYMGRYIERVRRGGFGESFDYGALRRISFRMPPFVDAYSKIVAPMDEDLRRQYVDLALERASNGPTNTHRYDGIAFLGRVDDSRAVDTLKDVYRQPANNRQLRIAAVRSLIDHGDEDVLRMLRDAEGTEQDPAVLAEVKTAAGRIEQRLAKQR